MRAVDLLAAARRLGVGVVQIGPNLPLDRLSEPELECVIRQAREWDLELEIGTRGLEKNHLHRQVAIAKRAGATLLRTIPELEGGCVPTAAQIAERLHSIIPELADSGVRIALENGKIPAEDLRAVLDDLGSPWVGVTLDTVNSLAIPEGWRHVAVTLAPHTMCLHVKDFVARRAWHMMGFVVEGRPAGKGQLDIPWLLQTLAAAQVSPNAILEVWPPEQEALEATIELEQAWAEESVNYLRQYIVD